MFHQHERELGMDGLLRIIKTAARHEALSDMANEVFAAAARHGTQADNQSLIIVRRAYGSLMRPGRCGDSPSYAEPIFKGAHYPRRTRRRRLDGRLS